MTISSSTGLATGLDIESIVTQLMDIAKRPAQDLQARVEEITAQQTAYAAIQAYLLQLQLTADQLEGDSNIFESRTCLLYTSPSPRDRTRSRMPSSA